MASFPCSSRLFPVFVAAMIRNLCVLFVPLQDGDREIRAMQFTETTTDTIFRVHDNGRTCFVTGDYIFGTKGTAYAAPFAPVSKNNLFEPAFVFPHEFMVRDLRLLFATGH
jgi:hypothetical protein